MSISLSQQLEQVHTSRREEPEENSRPLRQRLTGELGGHSSAGSQDDLPRANFQAEETTSTQEEWSGFKTCGRL